MFLTVVPVYVTITCEPLANVHFGRYSYATCSTQNVYNDTCEMTCDFGYVLERPQIQRCTLDWEWAPNNTGLCERKSTHVSTCRSLQFTSAGKSAIVVKAIMV